MRKPAHHMITLLIAALTILTACLPTTQPPPTPSNTIRTITIFHTSDEHGYLEPISDRSNTYGGAANLLAALRQRGYDPNGDDTLLLSSGDMWTGPAISSWFQGESAVQVANEMGYDAATIGNHDFDFGQEPLRTNENTAEFPFLTANVTLTDTGKPPDFAQPYTIREVNNVQVAIVGLTTLETPSIVMPTTIEELAFGDYADALRRTVPQARAEGAKLVIVLAHVCSRELRPLIPIAAELSIPLLAGGHCHSLENTERNGVRVIESGEHWQAFTQVDIAFDTATGQVVSTEAELVPVEYATADGNPVTPDAGVEAIVAEWAAQIDEALGEVIGYTKTGIKVDWPMYNLLVDAWLWYYPEADIAISNFGGYREAIPPGEITRADIVATWPFENVLVDIELTGKQVADNLLTCGGTVAGLTYQRARGLITIEMDDGSELDPEATYHVLVNSFIYAGGDDCLFAVHNSDGYDTGIPWRAPVVEWLIAQETSPERPLETMLDATARGPSR